MTQQTQIENKRDISVSMSEANLYSFLVTLPLIIPIAILFSVFWSFTGILDGFKIIWQQINWFLVTMIAGIVVHEYLHKIGWSVAGKRPLKTIEFGFQWKTLTPYAHCTEPLLANEYRWGTALPGLILGILPCTYAICSGNATVLIWGMIFIFAAGGDFLILWLIRFLPKNTLVEDHPERAGCYVLENDREEK
jgi:hypothetical protein